MWETVDEMEEEFVLLAGRIAKLTIHMFDNCGSMESFDFEILEEQLDAMENYQRTLRIRIVRLKQHGDQ